MSSWLWLDCVVSNRLRSTLRKVLSGRADANTSFTGLCNLREALGFAQRVRGSHNICWHDGVAEVINLQAKGTGCKPYQVKQVRRLIERYRLGFDDE